MFKAPCPKSQSGRLGYVSVSGNSLETCPTLVADLSINRQLPMYLSSSLMYSSLHIPSNQINQIIVNKIKTQRQRKCLKLFLAEFDFITAVLLKNFLEGTPYRLVNNYQPLLICAFSQILIHI